MISNINDQNIISTSPYSIKDKNEDNLNDSKAHKDDKCPQKNMQEIENNLRKFKFFNENFELKSLIDSGSESKVYKIYNKKSKIEYALKQINNEDRTKKNINELKIASKMKQKNIILFYGYSSLDDDNSDYIIMENAKYGNLRNFQINVLKKAYLSESMLCFLTSQILNGLIYLHKCKIAHMDIKPQNIVIDEFINAKLIDFSISINYKDKELEDKIKLKFKGTNFYIPIEVHNEETINYKDLNKIDAYSLGVTLYSLAYGCYPFDLSFKDSKNYDSIFQKINNKLKFKNDIKLSSFFIDFISKLLEKDINKRMSIYEAAKHHWIKGADILMAEKENLHNINPFIVKLITNSIKSFNDFIGI